MFSLVPMLRNLKNHSNIYDCAIPTANGGCKWPARPCAGSGDQVCYSGSIHAHNTLPMYSPRISRASLTSPHVANSLTALGLGLFSSYASEGQ